MKTRSNHTNYVAKRSDSGVRWREKITYNNILKNKDKKPFDDAALKFIEYYEQKNAAELNEMKEQNIILASKPANEIYNDNNNHCTTTIDNNVIVPNQSSSSDTNEPITCLDFGMHRHKKHPKFFFCPNCDMYEEQLILVRTPLNRTNKPNCKYQCTAGHTKRTEPTVTKDERLHRTMYYPEPPYDQSVEREKRWEEEENAFFLEKFRKTIDRFSSYLQNWNSPLSSSQTVPLVTVTESVASQFTTTT
jgi:hypothetical protein